MKLVRTGIKFSYSKISKLLSEQSNKHAVHMHSHSAAGLSGHIKMHLRYSQIAAK